MLNILSKEGSGSSYKFQLRQESEEILCSGIGINNNKLSKSDPSLDDLFKHDIFYSDQSLDPKYEEEIIKNLKTFDLHEKMDAVTFSETFLENKNFYKTFELFSNNLLFNSCCKVIYDQKNYFFDFPEWFKLDQYHSIYEFIVAFFERTICQKFLISQEKPKLPQIMLSFIDERKLKDFFENRERVIKFMKEEYPNKSEKFFFDLDMYKILNNIKLIQHNITNVSKSINDIERQINVDDNAYMIVKIKELFSKLNEKEFIDELIFHHFDKSPLNCIFCNKIFDNLLDLLSKKNAKDLLNDDNFLLNTTKRNKNLKKKNLQGLEEKLSPNYNKIESKLIAVKESDSYTKIVNIKNEEKDEKNEILYNNYNLSNRSNENLFEGLIVVNKNTSNVNDNKEKDKEDKKTDVKKLRNISYNSDIINSNCKINNIRTLRENLDYQVNSMIPYVKINDENFNSSELNDTDSQYTTTNFSENRSIIFNFNKHISKKSPSFDKIMQKDHSKVKERKSVPPLSRNEEEIKKDEPVQLKEVEKIKLKEEEILENNINSVDLEEVEQKHLSKKNKKKRQQKFKKHKQLNNINNIEVKKVASDKKTEEKTKNNQNVKDIQDKINKCAPFENIIVEEKTSQMKEQNKENYLLDKNEENYNPNSPEFDVNDNNIKQNSFRSNYNQFRVYNDNTINYKNNNKNYNKFNKIQNNNNNYFKQPHCINNNNTRLNKEFLNPHVPIINHNPPFIPKDNYFTNQLFFNFLLANNQVYFKENLYLMQSRMHNEILQYSSGVTSYNEQIREIKDYCISYLQEILSSNLNMNVSLDVYGSYATDLSIECSDIDLCIKFNENISDKIEFMLSISKIFSEKKIFDSILPITTASVPIIKLQINPLKILKNESLLYKKFIELKNSEFFINYKYDLEEISKIKVDLNILEAQDISINVKWVREQLNFYPEIKQIIHVLKRYLQLNKLNCTFDGGLSSYSLILLIVAFFKHNKYQVVNYGKILFDFFKFYGNSFDFTTSFIDVSQINPYICVNSILEKYPCILDPITQKNVAKNSFRINDIKYSFCLAFDKLCKHNINYNLNEGLGKSIINEILLSS